jgi:hypothetical protein
VDPERSFAHFTGWTVLMVTDTNDEYDDGMHISIMSAIGMDG